MLINSNVSAIIMNNKRNDENAQVYAGQVYANEILATWAMIELVSIVFNVI
jgi:hypothetical protein